MPLTDTLLFLERSEEAKKSIFHHRTTLFEWLSITYLDLFYPMKNTPKRTQAILPPIFYELKNHPNVQIEHTKLVMSEKQISLGSTNITQKAFKQLSEANYCTAVDNSDFVLALK